MVESLLKEHKTFYTELALIRFVGYLIHIGRTAYTWQVKSVIIQIDGPAVCYVVS